MLTGYEYLSVNEPLIFSNYIDNLKLIESYTNLSYSHEEEKQKHANTVFNMIQKSYEDPGVLRAAKPTPKHIVESEIIYYSSYSID